MPFSTKQLLTLRLASDADMCHPPRTVKTKLAKAFKVELFDIDQFYKNRKANQSFSRVTLGASKQKRDSKTGLFVSSSESINLHALSHVCKQKAPADPCGLLAKYFTVPKRPQQQINLQNDTGSRHSKSCWQDFCLWEAEGQRCIDWTDTVPKDVKHAMLGLLSQITESDASSISRYPRKDGYMVGHWA